MSKLHWLCKAIKKISPLDGEIVYYTCAEMRSLTSDKACGPEGNWFEPLAAGLYYGAERKEEKGG